MFHFFYLKSFYPFCFDVLIGFCSQSQKHFITTPEQASGLCWLHEVRPRPSQKVSKQKKPPKGEHFRFLNRVKAATGKKKTCFRTFYMTGLKKQGCEVP